MKYTLLFLLSFMFIFAPACKGTKKTTKTTTTSSSSTTTTTKTETESRSTNDIPSFLARMIRDGRKADDNTQSVKIDMFEKDGQQFYGYNNCNGCADAMTVVYDISGKKVANCGGFAGFRGEYCEALAKAKTMYKSQNGKILIDEWKLGE